MFELDFYTNASGHSDILELLRDLNKRAKTNKTSRIRLKKITEYFTLLENFGFTLGYPYIKHIAGTELWELRPVSDRIFFASWKENHLILLHHFVKKSQKTPKYEIQRALDNLKEFLERDQS